MRMISRRLSNSTPKRWRAVERANLEDKSKLLR